MLRLGRSCQAPELFAMGDAYAPFKTNAAPQPGKPFIVRGISLAEGLTLNKVNRRKELLTKVNGTFRDIQSNSQLLEALDKFGAQAHEMITSERLRAAFDVTAEKESIRKLFGPDEFNQSLLLSCRRIEFGVPFVTVSSRRAAFVTQDGSSCVTNGNRGQG